MLYYFLFSPILFYSPCSLFSTGGECKGYIPGSLHILRTTTRVPPLHWSQLPDSSEHVAEEV